MPQRSRVVAEGTRSDALNSKEKQRIVAASATTAKRRRNEPHAIPATEEPKGTAVALDEESNAQYPQYNGQDPSAGMSWTAIDTSVLNAYRQSHRLKIPPAFGSSHNFEILSRPGIGQYSPTMARPKERRRVSKERLLLAVKKDFNNASANELESVASFLYVVRNKENSFRAGFTPTLGQ